LERLHSFAWPLFEPITLSENLTNCETREL
jgi:hypothetical protein